VEVGDQITITPYEVSDKPIEKLNQNDQFDKNNFTGESENNGSQSNGKLLGGEVEKEITN
jgi:hypothetical protein